jgi:hypothetical protein
MRRICGAGGRVGLRGAGATLVGGLAGGGAGWVSGGVFWAWAMLRPKASTETAPAAIILFVIFISDSYLMMRLTMNAKLQSRKCVRAMTGV